MAAPSDESAVLERLEAIFFKVALTDESAESLQQIIDQQLVRIISYLSPVPGDAVKNKVMEMLSHLNKRLQAAPSVRLPLMELLQLLKDPAASILQLNFAKVYIKMAFRRADAQLCSQLLPSVLTNARLANDTSVFLFALLSCFRNLTEKKVFEEINIPKLTPQVNKALLVILLLPYGVSPSQNQVSGISKQDYKAVLDTGLANTSEDLEKFKKSAINLIAAHCANKETGDHPEQFAAHCLVGSCDPVSRVSNHAQIELRHVHNSIDWTTSVTVLETLIALYLGAQKPVEIPPADLRLRLKILPAIAKFSTTTTSQVRTRCIQLLFETLFTDGSNTKLKLTMIQLAHTWLDAWSWGHLSPIAPLLSTAFVKLINGDDDVIKPLSFSAVGKLWSKFPSLLEANFNMVINMYKQVPDESASSDDIEQALIILAPAICQSIPNEKRDQAFEEAEKLVELSGQSRRCSRVALRILRLMPANHMESRLALFRLSSNVVDVDFRNDCSKAIFEALLPAEEQAVSLISGVANPSKPQVVLPRIAVALKAIFEEWCNLKIRRPVNFGTHSLPLPAFQSTQMCLYIRSILAVAEASAPPLDILVASLQFSDLQRSSPFLHQFLCRCPKELLEQLVQSYATMLLDLLKCCSEPLGLFLLVELVNTLPQDFLKEQTVISPSSMNICQSFATSTSNFDAVELFSEFFGRIFSCQLPSDKDFDFDNMVKSHLSFVRPSVSLLCISHLLLRAAREGVLPSNLISTTLPKFQNKAISILEDKASENFERLITLKAIACACLLLPVSNNEKIVTLVSQSWTKAASQKEARLRPWAIQAFGRLGCSLLADENSEGIRQKAIQKLLELTPDEDIYTWMAQALVDLVLGPLSTSTCDLWRAEPANFEPLSSNDQLLAAKLAVLNGDSEQLVKQCEKSLNQIVDWMLTKWLRSANKFLRECGLICLFFLLRSGLAPLGTAVKGRFADVNNALLVLLSDDNARVQQALCELLSFMYEATDDDDREQQLTPLIDVLLGKKNVGVTLGEGGANAEVFKEGTLGDAPEGQRLSTYKELCSLASDLNQPDLIYRFMQLANHNASWMSKACAAAGLGQVLSKSTKSKSNAPTQNVLASSLLAGVGKLYRYQFDPDSGVKSTMAQLWQMVLANSGSNGRDLINANLEAILADIATSLPSRLWRVRESACGALSDSMRVVIDPHDKRLLKHLPEFWNAILHLCDDIKESVRVAATRAARSLQKVTLRLAQQQKESEVKVCQCNVFAISVHFLSLYRLTPRLSNVWGK